MEKYFLKSTSGKQNKSSSFDSKITPRVGKYYIEEERFRYSFLIMLSLIGAMFTIIFNVASMAGTIPPLSKEQFDINTFSISANFLIALSMWYRPILWRLGASVSFANYGAVFLVGLYTMPGDELRFAWFFAHATGSFLLLGYWVGWLSVSLSIIIIIVSKIEGLIAVSDTASGTFCLGLLATAAVLHCYELRASFYRLALQKAYEEVLFASDHDPLTGLFSRTVIEKFKVKMWNKAQLENFPISFIYIDLDFFKSINDTYGHEGGDNALIAVASAIKHGCRRTDFAVRLGGEEMLLVLIGTDAVSAYEAAERLRGLIEHLRPELGGKAVSITASIGWATADSAETPMHCLLRQADEAMYMAKKNGRNQVYPVI